jgi:hypothetical protein
MAEVEILAKNKPTVHSTQLDLRKFVVHRSFILHFPADDYQNCGARLYEDYETTYPETIRKLSTLINRPTSAMSRSSGTFESLELQSTSTSGTISNDSAFSNTTLCENPSAQDAHCCQIVNGSCTLCAKRTTKKFLALCINTGRFHKTLGEIDVTNIQRDSDTFRQIKSLYLTVRSFRARARRLFLLQPNNIHFVKVPSFPATPQ